MPSEDTKVLEFNQYQKSDKTSSIYYLSQLLNEKIDGCKNNLEKSSSTKVDENNPSGFSMCTISSFKDIKNKHDLQ